MALRESLWGAAGALRTRPELFVLGVAVGLLQAAVYALGLVGLSALAPGAETLVEGVAVLVSLFVVRPLYVGLYELTLRPQRSASGLAALRRAATTAFRRYPAVLRTDAAIGLAAVFLGLLVGLGWFVTATAGRYVRYALADPAAPHAMESVFMVAGAALVGAFLGGTLFRFADAVTAFEARRAVAASATAARRHPVALAGFAVAVVAIHLASLGALVGVATAGPEADSTLRPGLVAVAVALHGVGVTLVGVLHAAFYRDHVAPAVGATDASEAASPRRFVAGRSVGRLALAVVLVVGLVAGAAAVRTLDPGVHTSPQFGSVSPDDPDEAVRTAEARTAAANHRQVMYSRNASDPEGAYRVLKRAGYDHADRQLYVFFVKEDGEEFGGFFADGTLALLRPGGELDGLTTYERGSWQVVPAPGWGLAGGRDAATSSILPGGDVTGWRVVSVNASTLVVRYDDPDTVDDALGPHSFDGMTEPLANGSHVTTVIDRQRGVLVEARFHLHPLETGQDWQYRLEYRAMGTADLRRPAPIRDRRLAERLWDAVYY